jgi:hypothetical protein
MPEVEEIEKSHVGLLECEEFLSSAAFAKCI